MIKYSEEQLEELRRFRSKFAGDKINAVCSIIEELKKNTHELKKDIIQQVANEYHISTHTVNYWLNQYNQNGVTTLLDKQTMMNIVTQFLDNEQKPYSEWSRSSLCEYLNGNDIIVLDEMFQMTFSQSFCRDLLRNIKSQHKIDMTKELNDVYRKSNGANLIFVDYIKLPWKQNLPSYNYEFIIFYDYNSIIKKISNRCKRQTGDNEIVAGFKEVITYLVRQNLLREDYYIVLRDNMITRKIMDFYKREPYNLNILVGKGTELDPGHIYQLLLTRYCYNKDIVRPHFILY